MARRAVAKTQQAGHEDRAHAPLPPSASGRWLKCTPSQGYIKRLIERKTITKRKSGAAAERGTRIHELGEQFIKWLLDGKKIDSYRTGDPGEIAEAKDYAHFVMRKRNELELLHGEVSVGVEDRAVMIHELCWGSRDVWLVADKHVCVVDLKSGYEPVTVEDNTQMIIYASDLVAKYDPDTVEVCIWQPNAMDMLGPERSHIYTRAEYDKILAEVHAGAVVAGTWLEQKKGHEEHLVAGDHCSWCDALGVCPKAYSRNMEISSKKFEPVPIHRASPPPVAALEADQVAEIMRRAPLFLSWLEAVETRALELESKGKKVPGFKVVPKITRWAWQSKFTDAQIARGLGINVKELTKTVRLSPSDAKKMLDKRGQQKLAKYIFKPEGLPTVVPDSDRRTPLLATRINFTPISKEEIE